MSSQKMKSKKHESKLDERMASDLVAQIIMRLNDKKRDRQNLIDNLKIGLNVESKHNKDFIVIALEQLKKLQEAEDIKKIELEA